jgi:hypothetical protein
VRQSWFGGDQNSLITRNSTVNFDPADEVDAPETRLRMQTGYAAS